MDAAEPMASAAKTNQAPGRRRARKILIVLLVILIGAYFTYTPIISSLIARALQNAVDSRLHAQLQYDSLTYLFPYHVRLVNVRLQTDESLGNEQLLTIAKLDLKLAHIPLPRRPVVIQSLIVESPSLRIVKGFGGIVGAKGLGKTDAERRARPPARRISDMLELRKFAIADGQVTYEDRTIAGAEPLVFRGMSSDFGVMPKSRAVYEYDLRASQPPFVQMQAAGTIDVDQFLVEFRDSAMTLKLDRVAGASAIPPQLQRIVNEIGLAGMVTVKASGTVPVRELSGARGSVELTIADARASLPSGKARLDKLDATILAEFKDGQTTATLKNFSARSGGANFTVADTIGRADATHWSIEKFNGMLEVPTSKIPVEGFQVGRITLQAGSIDFTGNASGVPNAPAEYQIDGTARAVSALLPGFSSPAEQVAGTIQIKAGRVTLSNVEGDLLGARVGMSGSADLRKPHQYEAALDIQSADLSQLAQMPLMRGRLTKLSGLGNLHAKASGDFPDNGTPWVDHLSADGDAQVTRSQFLELRFLNNIAEKIGISADSIGAGDAAGMFSIRDRTVTFTSAAVNTSVLGVQGKGTIDFDGQADLDIVAAPLGDWRKHIQQTHIPIVSDVAGQLAGQLQRMVSAGSRMLYEFRIQGKLSSPEISAVPAPALTQGAAKLFGRMMQDVKGSDLLKSLKE